MIQLTDEEILESIEGLNPYCMHRPRAVAKAQVKKVVEWGMETCPHDLFGEGTQCYKHACDMCWQALQEELND